MRSGEFVAKNNMLIFSSYMWLHSRKIQLVWLGEFDILDHENTSDDGWMLIWTSLMSKYKIHNKLLFIWIPEPYVSSGIIGAESFAAHFLPPDKRTQYHVVFAD